MKWSFTIGVCLLFLSWMCISLSPAYCYSLGPLCHLGKDWDKEDGCSLTSVISCSHAGQLLSLHAYCRLPDRQDPQPSLLPLLRLGWQLWILILGLAQTICTWPGTFPYCSRSVAKELKETRWSGSVSTWNVRQIFPLTELGGGEAPMKRESPKAKHKCPAVWPLGTATHSWDLFPWENQAGDPCTGDDLLCWQGLVFLELSLRHELYGLFWLVSLPVSASFRVRRLGSSAAHPAPSVSGFLIVLCWLTAFQTSFVSLQPLCPGHTLSTSVQCLFWALFLSHQFWFWICYFHYCCWWAST